MYMQVPTSLKYYLCRKKLTSLIQMEKYKQYSLVRCLKCKYSEKISKPETYFQNIYMHIYLLVYSMSGQFFNPKRVILSKIPILMYCRGIMFHCNFSAYCRG